MCLLLRIRGERGKCEKNRGGGDRYSSRVRSLLAHCAARERGRQVLAHVGSSPMGPVGVPALTPNVRCSWQALFGVFALPADHVHAWRLAAWMVSGVAYAAHIGYEHFKPVSYTHLTLPTNR